MNLAGSGWSSDCRNWLRCSPLICAYAVMHNHYHVVLHVDSERANACHEDDVLARWQTLFPLPVFDD